MPDKWSALNDEVMTILAEAGPPGSKEQFINYMIGWAKAANEPLTDFEVRQYFEKVEPFIKR